MSFSKEYEQSNTMQNIKVRIGVHNKHLPQYII